VFLLLRSRYVVETCAECAIKIHARRIDFDLMLLLCLHSITVQIGVNVGDATGSFGGIEPKLKWQADGKVAGFGLEVSVLYCAGRHRV
jgi:hypothetical protein